MPEDEINTKATKSGKNFFSKSSKSSKSAKKESGASRECGVNYCEAKPVNLGSMKTCLEKKFVRSSNLFFPGDKDYTLVCSSAYHLRVPVAVVYVEDVEEVKTVMKCAVDNGYKVSVRGGNHSFQGLGTMDGTIVIDMTRTCKTDEFMINKNDTGPHILEGSKYVGTMKAQAGCTNAVMLAMTHKHFLQEGGMGHVGSCPSVGITGYILGGGAGDISPYVGYAADIVKEIQLVLYDGSVITASEEENTDLYWASLGGGGGNGVITHLTFKVIQAPKQKEEEIHGRKFTNLRLTLGVKEEFLEKSAARILEWFYDADPLITGKFGGSFSWNHSPSNDTFFTLYFMFDFVYLGSWKEAIKDLQTTGLYDEELFFILPSVRYPRAGTALLVENYEELCHNRLSCPEVEKIHPVQFNSYAEAEAFNICKGPLFDSILANDYAWSNTSGDFCKDLGIDDDYCEDKPSSDFPSVSFRIPKRCTDKVVIDAILEAAGHPLSFINLHGPSPELINRLGYNVTDGLKEYYPTISPYSYGNTMVHRFDDEFFGKLMNETKGGGGINHLLHGASLQVHPDKTALPWRNSAGMIPFVTQIDTKYYLDAIVKGGYTPQGYYNYLGPIGMKNWRSYYFGSNWRKLAEIRAKYDPKDVFGKPLTIESIGE